MPRQKEHAAFRCPLCSNVKLFILVSLRTEAKYYQVSAGKLTKMRFKHPVSGKSVPQMLVCGECAACLDTSALRLFAFNSNGGAQHG